MRRPAAATCPAAAALLVALARCALVLIALALAVAPRPALARTWHILPDGTGDAPTIQAGIDSAGTGDEVLVAPGTYWEILTMKSGIALRSEAGSELTSVHALYSIVICVGVTDATIEGFTLADGRGSIWGEGLTGGGILCVHSSVTIRGNVIRDCYLFDDSQFLGVWGGGIACLENSSPLIEDNVLISNEAWGNPDGGGIHITGQGVEIRESTIWGNDWNGISCYDPGGLGPVSLVKNIIACNDGCGVEGDFFWVRCCDVWGNSEGEYCVGPDPTGTDGNISQDPLFCDPEAGDFHLDCRSPCAPAQQPDCGLMGALEVGCGASVTVPTTWGLVKTLFHAPSHR